MRIAILHFSPANCDLDLFSLAKEAGFEAVALSVSEWCQQWQTFDAVFIMGATELSDELKQALWAFDRLGKPILGLAKGVDVLVKSGILPGLEDYRLAMQVVPYEDCVSEVTLVPDYQLNAYTRLFEGTSRFPVQNSPLCFEVPCGLLFEMSEHGLALFYAGKALMGVSNKRGNAMALSFFFKKGAHWQQLFQSLSAHITSVTPLEVTPLHYYPRTF